jgi:hypothetical protein
MVYRISKKAAISGGALNFVGQCAALKIKCILPSIYIACQNGAFQSTSHRLHRDFSAAQKLYEPVRLQ